MASFNKVILVGNLTRDPQVKYLPSGTAITEIGLAVNRRWLDKQSNTWKEEVTFVDVTLWARTAEIAGEYLSKGKQVLIEGRLQLDTWEDRETKQKRSKLKVIGENMTMLGSRGDGGPSGGGRASGAASRGSESGGESGSFSQEPSDYPSYEEPSSAPPTDEVPF